MGARKRISPARLARLREQGHVPYGKSAYVFHRFDTETMRNVVHCALCRKTVRLQAYHNQMEAYQEKIEFYLAHCHDEPKLMRMTYHEFIHTDTPF